MNGMRQEFFLNLQNRLIFQVANVLYMSGVDPDFASLVTELEKQGFLEEAGGYQYIATIGNDLMPELSNTKHLIEQLEERYINTYARTVYEKSAAFLEKRQLTKNEILTLTDNINRNILAKALQEKEAENLGDVIRAALKKAREGRADLIKTRIPKLDDLLGGGLERGEYVIVGARPGGGKSALALDFAVSTAMSGEYAMFCATEMEKGQIGLRTLSKITNVPTRQLIGAEDSASPSSQTEGVVEKGISLIEKSKLLIYDDLTTCGEIIAEYKRQRSLGKDIRVLVVDYIQQLQADKEMAKMSQYEQLKEMSNRLMRLAVDDQITVVCCSQLRRGASAYDAPDLGSMLGSGAIEQDATKVLTLGWIKDDKYSVMAYLIKNRSGRTGKLKLRFYGACFAYWTEDGTEIENL